MMLDSLLLENIQTLSRATDIESIASLLLEIIHQHLVLEKTVSILDWQSLNVRQIKRESYFCTTVTRDFLSRTNSVVSKPQITFYNLSCSDRTNPSLLAPFSLVNRYRCDRSAKIFKTDREVASFQDSYLDRQKPVNFYCFPLLDREQFFGILYLENLRDSLTTDTDRVIKILVTQAAIALNNTKQYGAKTAKNKTIDGLVLKNSYGRIKNCVRLAKLKQNGLQDKRDREALEAERQQNLLLGKIVQKIRSYLNTQDIFQSTVTEIGTTFGVTRSQIHSCVRAFESIAPIFALYQAPEYLIKTEFSFSLQNHLSSESVFPHDRAVAVENVYESPLLKWADSICQQLNIKSILAIRTSYRGEANGLIMLHQCDRYRRWTQAEIETIEIIAARVGIAIAHTHLLEGEKPTSIGEKALAYPDRQRADSRAETFSKKNPVLTNAHPQASSFYGGVRVSLNRQVRTAFTLQRPKVVSQNELLKEISIDKYDREQLKKQSATMETAIDGMAILEGEHFIYLNPSFSQIFGYDSTDELLGRNWRVIYRPLEVIQLEKEALPVLERQNYWRGECQGRKRDGTIFELEITAIRLENERVVYICRDNSDRKQQERELQESQKRYQSLAAAAPVGIFRTDAVGNLTYVNGRWCGITGLIPQLAKGKKWLEAIHYCDRQQISQKWQAAINNRQIFSAEYRFVTPHNVTVWVFGQAVAEYSMQGELLGYVGTITNISKLKKSQKVLAIQLQKEQLLGQITQEIRRSWNLSAIFETAVTQIGEVFQVSRCCIYNYVCNLTPEIPIAAQYITRQKVARIDLAFPGVDNPQTKKILEKDKAIAFTDLDGDILHSEMRQFCLSCDLKSMLVVRTSDRGKPNGIIALHQCDNYRDWTNHEIELLEIVAIQLGIAIAQARLLAKEQQQHQELYLNNLALTKAKQEAEIANQAKSQFLAQMSHELRTPLNAILGFSQIMARDSSLDSEQQEYLTIINRSGKHLLDLINDILDLAKIEAGKASIQEDILNLNDFVLELTKMFQLEAQSKGLKFAVEINSDVPQAIVTDSVKLRQIAINLLNNAIKFTTTGEIKLQVKSPNQQSLILKVIDTGAGIDRAELDRLFEPFEQTTTGLQSKSGTGLGLTICRSLIELLGGILEVESVVGEGTTFLCQIPLKICDLDRPSSQESDRSFFQITSDKAAPYRILVVDDNLDNRRLLDKLLTQIGFIVKEASNGREAVSLFTDWHPDLILMDIYLPIMDGYEAIAKIQELDSQKQVKIIATTASLVREETEQVMAIGCVDVVSKPFDTEKLLKAIAKQLNLDLTLKETKCNRQNWYDRALISTNEVVRTTPNLCRDTFQTETTQNLDSLQKMSLQWLEKLHHAAISASEPQIYESIDEISAEYPHIAENLKNMVENFALEGIIKQTEYLLKISN